MTDEIALNHTQLATAVRAAIDNKMRLLIKGEPGIGKTESIEAITEEKQAKLIVMHPSVDEPTDYKGMPFVIKEKGVFVPFDNLDAVLNATSLTVLFMDDLGQATNAVQSAVMQLADRLRKNPNVVLIGATNERAHRANVTGLLEPVKSRFHSILKLYVSFPSWKIWALDHDIDYRVLGYLEQQPEALHKFDPTADIVNQPNPRTWSAASKWMKGNVNDEDVRFALLAGAVGAPAATSFKAWLKIAEQAPSREEVMADPSGARVPSEPSALYAVCASLPIGMKAQEFPAISTYAQRMYKEEHGEFCALLLRDVFRKMPDVKKLPSFVQLAKSPLAELVMSAVRFNETASV